MYFIIRLRFPQSIIFQLRTKQDFMKILYSTQNEYLKHFHLLHFRMLLSLDSAQEIMSYFMKNLKMLIHQLMKDQMVKLRKLRKQTPNKASLILFNKNFFSSFKANIQELSKIERQN